MATERVVTLVDDIDQSEGASSYTFAFQGTTYEIDLSDAHRDELLQALQPYIAVGRRQGRASTGRTSAPRRSQESATIRAWARENGHQVPDRGRLSQDVVAAYRAAQS